MERFSNLLGIGIISLSLTLLISEYREPYPSSFENNLSRFIYTMDKAGIRFPEIVLSQALLETGWFSSKIYRENNNLFGMKAGKNDRIQYGHAWYANAGYSVFALKRWQEERLRDYELHRKKVVTEKDYYEFLECLCIPKTPTRSWGDKDRCYRYAEDPKYVTKVKEIRRWLQTQINS